MVVFLNESSIGQHATLGDVLRFFWGVLQELAGDGNTFFRDSTFYFCGNFQQRFNDSLGQFSQDIRPIMRSLVFSDEYFGCWRPDRCSTDTQIYSCKEPPLQVCDVTLCEAAERQITKNDLLVCLLSAESSEFGKISALEISNEESGELTRIHNISSLDAMRQMMAKERGFYSPNSTAAPRDFQTILLIDTARFRRTQKVERRFQRRIFEEAATGRQFYVDEGHPGHSAHLEVFDSNDEHLGTADINTGELDATAKVDGRKIRR